MSRLRKRCSSEGIQGREGKVIPGTVVGVTTARHFLRRGSIDRFAVGTLTTNCVGAASRRRNDDFSFSTNARVRAGGEAEADSEASGSGTQWHVAGQLQSLRRRVGLRCHGRTGVVQQER